MRKHIRLWVAIVALTAAAVTLPRIVSSRQEIRDVTLVVRNMTYYLEGSDAPNPALRFAAGERVRVTLRNEDGGMSHDFTIKTWGVATQVLEGKGQNTVTFRVPARSAVQPAYTCTPHTAMMNGTIVVE
jgi:plastocyanin